MNKIGLFYGPAGGSVEKIAHKVLDILGEDKVDVIHVQNADASDFNNYKYIIMGISTIGAHTWNQDTPSKDWDWFVNELNKVDYSNKTFALYGLGDHITYARHSGDSLGILGKELLSHGAKIIGQCDPAGYEFIDSEAVIDGQFIGLPLDEDFAPDETDARLGKWLDTLIKEFN